MLRTPVSLNTLLVIRGETIVINGNTEQIGISATVFKVLGVKHKFYSNSKNKIIMETQELLKMLDDVKSILRRPLVNSTDIQEAIQKITFIQSLEQQIEDAYNDSELSKLENQSSEC